MRTGTLRHLVQVIHPAIGVAKDAYNVPTDTMVGVGSEWCAIEQIDGSESFKAQQMQAGVTTQVTMRYRDDISPRHRLLKQDGRYLEVVSTLDPEGRKRKLVLMCKEAA